MKPMTSTDIWFCCDYLEFTAGLKTCQSSDLPYLASTSPKEIKAHAFLFSFQVASQTPNRLLGTQGQTIKCLCTLWTPFCHRKSWRRICSLEFNTHDLDFLKGIPLAPQSKRRAGSTVIYFPLTLGRISKHLAATFLLPQMSAYHKEILMSGAPFPPQRGMFRSELCNLFVKNLLIR